jgi:parvulin-like peptidyl-prolyl isomerase
MKTNFKAVALTLLLSSLSYGATVATVNGVKINSDEVDQVLMQGTQGRFNELPAEKQNELRKNVVEGMITQELVFADAKKEGVMNSSEYKIELENVLQRVKKQLAAKVWEKKQFDKIDLAENDIKSYYKNNSEEFMEKEQVHARHILVKTEDEAKTIIAELKSLSGDALQEKFIELAKTKSTGPSGPKGGDLGSFAQGQMVPVFNNAVFNMKVGTITMTPVVSQFGSHVIYLEDKTEGTTLSYEEVKKFIEQKLKMEKFKSVMETKMSALKGSAKITYGH